MRQCTRPLGQPLHRRSTRCSPRSAKTGPASSRSTSWCAPCCDRPLSSSAPASRQCPTARRTRLRVAPHPPHDEGSLAVSGERGTVTSIEPELWVENPREALAFYGAAFGATVLHLVGDGEDIVAQLGVGDAAFWVAPVSSTMKRLSPRAIDGATSRTLLVVDDPDTIAQQAVRAGAKETSPVGDEHGWRLGRIIDPFGHEWEIGKPLGPWPPI